MSHLYDRLEVGAGPARIRSADATVDDVVELLEASKTPLQVVTGLGIETADLVAALAFAALGPIDSDGLTLIRDEPNRPDLLDSLRESSLAILCVRTPKPVRLALSAGLLQIFDFWDDSHTAAQEADDLGERVASSYWHAIAHRREPDPGNAAYWFRRVGRHAVLPTIGERASSLIQAAGNPAWASHLVSERSWDPLAFVNAVQNSAGNSASERLARQLQSAEMLALLEVSLHDLV